MKNNKNMDFRIVKKSVDGKFAIQQFETTPKEIWVDKVLGFDTFAGAETHLITVLGFDVKQEVIAVYKYDTKIVNP